MKKRIFAFLLSLCLLGSLLPQTISPARAAGLSDWIPSEWDAETSTLTFHSIPASEIEASVPWLASLFYEGGERLEQEASWFQYRNEAKKVVIEKADGILPNLLNGFTAVESIELPDGITSIGKYAFMDCTNLTSITLPDGVTSIGANAFNHCTSLTSITIPASVTSIRWAAFAACYNLEAINVAEENAHYCSADGVVFTKDKSTLLKCPPLKSGEYVIPNSVSVIGEDAFECCLDLTNVIIPSGVTQIEEGAFSQCESLTSVTIPDSITTIGDAVFFRCGSLTSVTIGNGVTAIGYRMFFECPSLTSVTIPESVTTIGGLAFSSCHSLTNVTIPNSVTTIGQYAFNDCDSLTSVTIPDSVTTIEYAAFFGCNSLTSVIIGNGVTTISSSVFEHCQNLIRVDIGNSVTTIGESAFGNCFSLTSITIPDNVTTISSGAFEYCISLTNVIIGNGVTSIGASAFYDCYCLGKAIIGNNVKSIGSEAFRHCDSLGFVYFLGNAPEMGSNVFSLQNEEGQLVNNPQLTIYYTEGKDGWTSPIWYDYPTATWDGVNGPHIHSYQATVTAPTCTEKGYTTHACACGDSYVDTHVDALGHDFKDGVCTRCGAKDPNWVEPTPVQTFPDVKEGVWYYDSVMYATSHGIFKGNTDGTFGPGNPMNRAMLVTTLHRLAGEPAPKAAAAFSDVDAARYYAKPVAWAAENGIVNGMGDNKFQPNTNVTREQAATFLYRYAAYAKLDTTARADLSKFPDANKVSNFAKDSLSWASAEGLINGKKNTQTGVVSLSPKGSATRAELAKILMSFMENVAK